MNQDMRELILQNEFEKPATQAVRAVLDFVAANPDEPVTTCIQRALEACHEHSVHPLVLASRLGAEVWFDDVARRHAETCDDPDCSDECRALRGLPAKVRK